MQMVTVSVQNLQRFQLCFERPHTMLNGTVVFTEAKEDLFSVYSNSKEIVKRKVIWESSIAVLGQDYKLTWNYVMN